MSIYSPVTATSALGLAALGFSYFLLKYYGLPTILIRKSFLIQALPFAIIAIVLYRFPSLTPLPLVLIIIEEGYKFALIRLSRNRIEGLCLAALSGVWEILIFKTAIAASDRSMFFLDYPFEFTAMIYIPLFMHILTSSIYFLFWWRLPWVQLIVGVAIHFMINQLAFFYVFTYGRQIYVSTFLIFLVLFLLIVALLIIWIPRLRYLHPPSVESRGVDA